MAGRGTGQAVGIGAVRIGTGKVTGTGIDRTVRINTGEMTGTGIGQVAGIGTGRMTAAGTDQAAGTGLIGAEETDMTRIGVRRVTGIGQQNVTVPGTVTGTLRRTETGARPETGNSRNQSQKTGRSSCGGPSSAATVRF